MSAKSAAALHAQLGDTHVVGVSSLRVLLLEDGKSWFAQGLEVDYAAGGATQDEAKKNFEQGFCKTIQLHLELHGHLKNFFRTADQATWDELMNPPQGTNRQRFSCVQIYDIPAKEEEVRLPFDQIAFLSRQPELAEAA